MRLTTRTASTAVSALLAGVAALAAAGPAAAAPTRPAPRQTLAVLFAQDYLASVRDRGGDDRSVAALSAVAEQMTGGDDTVFHLSGISDRNHDGRDDDGIVLVRAFANTARIDLRQPTDRAVTDAGFTLRDRHALLRESARNLDTELRWAGSLGQDNWDMELIRFLANDVPAGVRVTSDFDGNHDGLDDDGRLTLLAGGHAVTLTIGNTPAEPGRITFGPAWKTPAPHRVHPGALPLGQRSAPAQRAALTAAASQLAKVIAAESAADDVSARAVAVIRRALSGVDLGGVTVSGLVDGNRDGLDDDGALTLTAGKAVVRLNIGAEVGAVATVTVLHG